MESLQQAVQDNDQNAEEEEINTFPGPGLIKCNNQLGIYVVASRTIEPGEQICEENPLMISPRLDWEYSSANEKEEKICLGCYKKCSWSKVCSRCEWPVCDKICEKAFIHSQFECELFTKHQIRSRNLPFDYAALETLRCLQLREQEPKKWNKLLRHESHVSRRQLDAKTKECREYVIDFIQNQCHLRAVYESELIERVMGIISINSFCMMNDYHRHASLIFHSASYIAHNCDPNMDVIWMFHPRSGSTYDQQFFAVKFFAARRIEAGELLTFSYMFNWKPVIERQRYLANYWYFNCECHKCRTDFFHELLNLSEWEFMDEDGSGVGVDGCKHSLNDSEGEEMERGCESCERRASTGKFEMDISEDSDNDGNQGQSDIIEFGWIGDSIGILGSA